MTAQQYAAIGVALILIVAVACIIATRGKGRSKQKVAKTSRRYLDALIINKKYSFYGDVNACYEFSCNCTVKKKYDCFDFDANLASLIESEGSFFTSLVHDLSHNNSVYSVYLHEYNALLSTALAEDAHKLKMSYRRYRKIENELFDKARQAPTLNTQILCTVRYVSPAGRNEYSKCRSYSFAELKLAYDNVQTAKVAKLSKRLLMQAERAKLNDSLRYDVLKRDGFRCRLCGASARDGAKLHVDHIIPVSKGGRTEMNNLRVLCERCNLGKSDKDEGFTWFDA